VTHILLTGAGLSRNWGGVLAHEVFQRLIGDGTSEAFRNLLWRARSAGQNFEDVLAALQSATDDGARQNFVECPPVISVHIAADAAWRRESGVFPLHNGQVYTAMLDTGANRIAIRPEVANAIGAVTNGLGVGRGIGGVQDDIKRTSIQVVSLKGGAVFVCLDAAVMALPGDARSFDAILGRQFLRFCRFC
jgi:hypothetical protein